MLLTGNKPAIHDYQPQHTCNVNKMHIDANFITNKPNTPNFWFFFKRYSLYSIRENVISSSHKSFFASDFLTKTLCTHFWSVLCILPTHFIPLYPPNNIWTVLQIWKLLFIQSQTSCYLLFGCNILFNIQFSDKLNLLRLLHSQMSLPVVRQMAINVASISRTEPRGHNICTDLLNYNHFASQKTTTWIFHHHQNLKSRVQSMPLLWETKFHTHIKLMIKLQ